MYNKELSSWVVMGYDNALGLETSTNPLVSQVSSLFNQFPTGCCLGVSCSRPAGQ